jgi:SulP family sulfate permease
MLDELGDTLAEEGVAVRVARDIGDVRDVLRRAGSHLDVTHVYPTVQAAVDAAQDAQPAPDAPLPT